MAVTVYRSTDSSAPVLDGLGGSLVNLLDKCLVTGYGSKAAAGWTKPYTGTNAAVFRQGGGNGFYLDVNDNGPGAATTQEARLRGYEAMTAVATGTNPFPTVAQSATLPAFRKSAAATATTRTWLLIADDRTFYLFVQTGDAAGVWFAFMFGDFYSYVAGTDGYRTMIMGGRAAENSNSTANEIFDNHAANTALTLHYAARSYTGLGGSLQIGKTGDMKGGSASFLSGATPTPNPVDGSIWIAPVFVIQTGGVIRGKMRGLHHFLHTTASVADQDTVTGAGAYAGRTFLLIKTVGNGNIVGCLDITGPWDTN